MENIIKAERLDEILKSKAIESESGTSELIERIEAIKID